jgi:carboxypeptidase PM20D1
MYAVLIIVVAVVVLLVVLVRAFRFTSVQVQVDPVTDITVDEEAAQHLGKAIQFKTISYQDPSHCDENEFLKLHKFLEKTFPTVHSTLTKEPVENYSLLYTWKGRNAKLNPILLMSHLDVVPIAPGTESNWVYPPFSGEVKEGYIWGRGSMDIKSGVMSILEAVEHLVKEGFQPERTVYLAFGHDEEVGGPHGASSIAALLQSRNVVLEYVLDEGGAITKGVVPGVSAPVALVGIAEKGYISVELTVKSEGGHSSMPPRETAVGILSAAIHNLGIHRFPGKIKGVVRELFHYAGPEMSFGKKVTFANLWLFGRVVKTQLARSPKTDALIRTTTAPTIIEGGTKENVLPEEVRAVVNFRILPGETTKTVLDHVRKTIDDPRVKVTTLEQAWNPSVVSDIQSETFKELQKTIRQIFPGTVVTPYLVTGATDSRHYAKLTRNVFKCIPLIATPEDLKRVHGTNERISVENYKQCIQFFVQLIRNSA